MRYADILSVNVHCCMGTNWMVLIVQRNGRSTCLLLGLVLPTIHLLALHIQWLTSAMRQAALLGSGCVVASTSSSLDS